MPSKCSNMYSNNFICQENLPHITWCGQWILSSKTKGGNGHPAGARAIGGSLHGAIQYVLHSEIKRMLEPQPVVNSLRRVQKGNPLMWIPRSHSNHGVVKEECLYKRKGKLPTIWISLTFLGPTQGWYSCVYLSYQIQVKSPETASMAEKSNRLQTPRTLWKTLSPTK